MKLSKILEGIVVTEFEQNINVVDVVADSRKVKPGSVFVAYKGVEVDGHDYIKKAVEMGAVAVVGEVPMKLPVAYFMVPSGRLAWAQMLANFYGNPEKKLIFIGVTGTDGKTTTTNLIFEILKTAGIKVSMVSTIKAIIAGREFDTGLHTSSPDPDVLWPWLVEAVKAGVTHMILEVTSHGLSQSRIGGINFEIGVLTNLAHDHLDFHKTIEEYKSAKSRLFERSKVSILNACSKELDFFRMRAGGKVVAYDALDEIRNVKYDEDEMGLLQRFEVKVDSKSWRMMESRLLGSYNLENILAAIKTGLVLGIKFETIDKAVRDFKTLPGRLEMVQNSRGLHTIVDFAHTPQGMESVLSLARQHLIKKGEGLIVVFGCNGGVGQAQSHDITKRSPMGKIACRLADLTVVTAEDPRQESMDQIFAQIEGGCVQSEGKLGKNYFRVDDRKEAINFAINKLARKGDWIFVLGKGHEQSLNIAGVEIPWSDVGLVKEAIINK